MWRDAALIWLAQAAVGGLLVMAAGSLAARLCGQPAKRAMLAVLTLVGALLVPWLGTISFGPRWSAGLLPAVSAPDAGAETLVTIHTERPRLDLGSVREANRPVAPGEPSGLEAGSAVSALGPADAGRAAWEISWPRLLIAAHLTATSALLAWWLIGLARLGALTRAARPAPAAVRARFDALSGPAGRRVLIRMSDRISQPITYTWIAPVILLPAAMCDERADADMLIYALAHEWSHVERGDAWAWNFATLAGSVLFYQPLYWWLRRQLRLCQDYLADDRAVAFGSAEDYASCLVRLARVQRSGLGLPALGIGDRRSNLHRRVVMLVQDRQPLDRRCRARWSLAAAVCAIAWVVVVSQMHLEAAPPKDEPLPANEKPTPAASRPEGETLHYSGLVKDKDTGKPIEGATVVVRRSRSRSSENTVIEETRHRTDASGTYHFTIPPEQVAERYLYIELDVEHPDYATKAGFGYALGMIRKNEKLGERPFFENVELRPAEAITGTVQTPDGNAAAGVYVLGYSRTDKLARGQFEYGSFARTSTDAAGRFRMPITTPGQGVFWILPKAHAPEMHPLPDGKRGELGTFTLRPGVTLKGQLFDAQGKPLAGQFVEVTRERDGSPEFEILNQLIVADAIRRTAETDAEGRFSFDPLPAGTFRIMPTDRGRLDDESRSWTRKPLPGVFAPLKLVLKDDQTPEPLEIRAVPHVVIEGQWMDSQGKPKGGWSSMIFGRIDGQSWHAQASPDTNGKFTAMVPHGLERTQLDIMTNEHASFRYRIGKDGPLKTGRNVMLETLDHDVKDFQIVRYVAPIVLIAARSKDGTPIKTLEVTGLYTEEIPSAGTRFSVNGRQTDVFFERQNDGRYRTSSLTPDRAVKITVQADGFKAIDRTFKLAEGKTEEAALVLEPEVKGDPAAPGEPKRD